MNKLITLVGLFAVVSSLATIAEAKGHKPTVCFSFTEMTMPVDGEATKVAVCTDGKKPVILTSYQVIQTKNDEGATVKAVLGYR